MKIGMCGMGKLGLPVALAIESRGHEVMGYDVRPEPYEYIENHHIPYTEKDLQPLLDNTQITMTHSLGELVTNDIVFVPVQTPHDPQFEGATRLPDERKDFDYTYLKQALGSLATHADGTTVAVISTCLPGTYEKELKPLLNDRIDYVYSPQFIAMGTVLEDYLNPEFNLIGMESEQAADKLEEFFLTINDAPALRTDITTAEGIKVAYNTFITMKTVLGNTWGEMAQKLGMNVDDIYKSWTMSTKRLLSPKYLRSGVGDGGGCHPRDNIALSYITEEIGMSHNLFEDLMRSREQHMEWLAHEALNAAQERDLPIVVLGRSFKPETNIETGSPAILMANIIREHHADITHVEEMYTPPKAVYVIGTQHKKYKYYRFPGGSYVIDPFSYIPKYDNVEVVHIGNKHG